MSVYESLSLGPNQIRLVSISSTSGGQNGHPIQCSLEVVSLVDDVTAPKYFALSYTWGAPAEYGKFKRMTGDLSHQVSCNNSTILVSENLEAFLKRMQSTPWLAGKKFWIDGLGINQQDAKEREAQVKLMGRIYSSAENVVVWLGEDDEYTELAFRAVERIAQCVAENSLDENPAYLLSGEDILKLKDVSDREAWLSVGKLYQRSYFIRAWTIQEVILAQKLDIVCGAERISWDALFEASKFFSQTGWKVFLDNLSKEYPGEEELASYNHVPAMVNSSRQDRNIQYWATTLLYALKRSRDFKTTDPRDKVYCLLGLVEIFTRGKSRLDPVYGDQTVAKTYINAAIQLLEDGEDLHLLSCVEGEKFQRVAELPSWVPDWTCGEATGLMIAGYRRFSAAGTMTQRPQIDADALTLSIRGIKVDDVTMVGEAKHHVLSGGSFSKWLEIVASLPRWYREVPEKEGGEHRIEVFWRTLLRNTTGRPPTLIGSDVSRLQQSFKSWLQKKISGKAEPSADPEWEHMKKLGAKLLEETVDYISEIDQSQNNSSSPDVDFDTRLAWARHLRLFKTRNGYLGMGSECLQEGDSVWIVPSSQVPLIFRSLSRNHGAGDRWRLVGGTYLHGVMNGEFLRSNCSSTGDDREELLYETLTIE